MTYEKSKLTAYVLWLLIGAFGAHRFYLGRIKSGVLMCVMLLGGLALIALGTYLLYVSVVDKDQFVSDLTTPYIFLTGIGSVLFYGWLIWYLLDVIFIYFMMKKDRQNAATLSELETSNVFG